MSNFRGLFEFWNESGLIISIILSVGYFGSRQLLGHFPLFLAIALSIGALVLSYVLANAGQPTAEDAFEVEPRNRDVEKFMFLAICFLSGIGLFMFLGALV